MLKEQYVILTVVYTREKGVWTAECKELGTATFGDTFEEAETDLREAIEVHLSTLEDVGECERFLRKHHIRIYREIPHEVVTELPVRPDTWVNRNIVPLPAC
jgi:predicted RNase H-like HicB family nuclease